MCCGLGLEGHCNVAQWQAPCTNHRVEKLDPLPGSEPSTVEWPSCLFTTSAPPTHKNSSTTHLNVKPLAPIGSIVSKSLPNLLSSKCFADVLLCHYRPICLHNSGFSPSTQYYSLCMVSYSCWTPQQMVWLQTEIWIIYPNI